MYKIVAFIVLLEGCLAQQTAKLKCAEYATLAQTNRDSLQCNALTDKKNAVMIEPDEFPATAMLGYVVSSGEVRYLCDATLISEDTLLTAGHCLHQKAYGSPKWARLGATATTLGEEVEVKSSQCHPKYKPGNDIGIVKLQKNLNSSYVPACLDADGVSEGVHGVGVGRPIGSAYLELGKKCPLKSELEVKSGQSCKETFSRQNISTEATLCVKDPSNGPGDCLSGPLYVSRQDCVHHVIGVASFGKPCNNDTPAPSVYTSVYHYLSWLEEQTWPTNKVH